MFAATSGVRGDGRLKVGDRRGGLRSRVIAASLQIRIGIVDGRIGRSVRRSGVSRVRGNVGVRGDGRLKVGDRRGGLRSRVIAASLQIRIGIVDGRIGRSVRRSGVEEAFAVIDAFSLGERSPAFVASARGIVASLPEELVIIPPVGEGVKARSVTPPPSPSPGIAFFTFERREPLGSTSDETVGDGELISVASGVKPGFGFVGRHW